MERKGQGAIEYLLIIGAAILVVAIVIIAVTGVLGTTNDRGEQASGDQLAAQESMDTTGPAIIGLPIELADFTTAGGGVGMNKTFTVTAGRLSASDTLSNIDRCTITGTGSGWASATTGTKNGTATQMLDLSSAVALAFTATPVAGNNINGSACTITLTCFDAQGNSTVVTSPAGMTC